jgi:hypothetical protein
VPGVPRPRSAPEGIVKGWERNGPCFCGCGRKRKKCPRLRRERRPLEDSLLLGCVIGGVIGTQFGPLGVFLGGLLGGLVFGWWR